MSTERPPSFLVRAITVCYSFLLQLLPASQRERDGEEMVRTFEMRVRDRRQDGVLSLFAFCVAEALDVMRCAVRREVGVDSEFRAPGGGMPLRRQAQALSSSVHQAIRYVRARPGYAFVFVVTFALGLGVNAALFALVSAVALRPLPYHAPDRLIQVWSFDENTDRDSPSLPAAALESWSQFTDLIEGIEGWLGPGTHALTGDGMPERVDGYSVTPGLFEFLGIRPQWGRWFEGVEGEVGGPAVVLIGDGLWSRRFGREHAAIGSTLVFDGETYTVIGVMPRGFAFPYGTSEAWFPLSPTRIVEGEAGGINALARLRPGVVVETAEESLVDRVRAAQAAGAAPPGIIPMVVGLEDFLQTPERTKRGLLMLFGSVLLVLAIAVANVLSLRMADALRRHRELAMRSALGAGRLRLLLQLGSEGFVLAMLGSLLGLAIAQILLRGIVPVLPDQLGINTGGRALTLWPDGVAYGLLISALAGPVIGVLPALLLPHRLESLQGGTRATTERRGVRLQSGLIVCEVALSLVLLVGAGLLLNSFVRLSARDAVVAADELVVAEITLGPSFASDAERAAQFQRYEEHLRRVGGVASVAATTSPLPRSHARFRPKLETADDVVIELDGFLPYHEVSAGFFETAGIRILEGRAIGPADAGTPVAVVNDVLGRRLWPNTTPVGSRFRARERDPWLTVIGIAEDVPQLGPRDPWGEEMEYYVPLPSDGASARRTFLIRTAEPPARLVHPMRQSIWELDETQPIDRIEPYRNALGATVARERFFLILLSLFAGLATLLAAVGLHAVLSQVLLRRTPEIAIRVALGASRVGVLWLTVGGSMKMVSLGIVLGLGLAVLLARFLDSLLFGIAPVDPLTFAVDTAVLLIVGTIASLGAARRALTLDPAVVMRRE